MAIHDKFAATAKRLIDKHGRDMTLYQQSRTPSNPAAPWEGAGTAFADSVTGKAVMTEYAAEEIDEVQIKRGDKKVLFAASNAVGKDLTKFEKLDDSGNIYGIVKVELIQPGTTAILYKVQIRG